MGPFGAIVVLMLLLKKTAFSKHYTLALGQRLINVIEKMTVITRPRVDTV